MIFTTEMVETRDYGEILCYLLGGQARWRWVDKSEMELKRHRIICQLKHLKRCVRPCILLFKNGSFYFKKKYIFLFRSFFFSKSFFLDLNLFI